VLAANTALYPDACEIVARTQQRNPRYLHNNMTNNLIVENYYCKNSLSLGLLSFAFGFWTATVVDESAMERT
jgi:hypothetical protein